MDHTSFMDRCLTLAEKGRGHVGINPLVGAVLVRDGKVITEGFYGGPGTGHAERCVLSSVEMSRRDVSTGTDTLYVNLEPCCHHGMTPPCTDIIIQKGIKRVVIGMVDPDPRVSGKGIEALRNAGIEVIGPVLRAKCERLNRGFISVRKQGRPFITLKRAQTLEGAVANPDGSKLCMTSKEQNIWSHTHLRTTHDAILVGVQTVITDDPQLTVRLNKNIDQNFPQPHKIILDPDLRIPLEAKVIGARTIVVTKDGKDVKDSKDEKERSLIEKGVEILHIPMEGDHFAWDVLWQKLTTYHLPLTTDSFTGISSLLVEGGPKTWDAFRSAGLIDEEVILVGVYSFCSEL